MDGKQEQPDIDEKRGNYAEEQVGNTEHLHHADQVETFAQTLNLSYIDIRRTLHMTVMKSAYQLDI